MQFPVIEKRATLKLFTQETQGLVWVAPVQLGKDVQKCNTRTSMPDHFILLQYSTFLKKGGFLFISYTEFTECNALSNAL